MIPKELVIISGKGGTGKTTLTLGLVSIFKNIVIADCDVDAPDLHLVLKPYNTEEKGIFKERFTAFINKNRCIECRKCRQVCRFEAISEKLIVDSLECQGCRFCELVCPQKAIEMREEVTGSWQVSQTRFGSFIWARLTNLGENSGKLVSLIREKARNLAKKIGSELVIIDGSPGIGCPVIASITGANFCVVVTEPSLSALHDADRVIKLTNHFKINSALVINKYDLNLKLTQEICDYAQKEGIPILGKIRFKESIVKAMLELKTVMESSDSEMKSTVCEIAGKIKEKLGIS